MAYSASSSSSSSSSLSSVTITVCSATEQRTFSAGGRERERNEGSKPAGKEEEGPSVMGRERGVKKYFGGECRLCSGGASECVRDDGSRPVP